MSFMLNSSKFMNRISGFVGHTNLSRSPKDISFLQLRNTPAINEFFKHEYAAVAPKIVTVDDLNKNIYQLDIETRYRSFVNKKYLQETLTALKKHGSVTYYQSLLLLKCCGKVSVIENQSEKISLVNKVWDDLKDLGIKFDIFHYNTILNVFLESEYDFSPSEFLEKLKNDGIVPNFVTYQRLLKAYCQQKNIVGATDLLEEMKKNDLSINEDIFNSLIYGHCQLNDLESAMDMFKIMEEKGISPNSDSYLHLICAHAKTGNIEKIKELIAECFSKDIILLDKDLFEVIYTLAVNNQQQHIEEILKHMNVKTQGISSHISHLIHRLLLKRLDSTAIQILETFVSKDEKENASRYWVHLLDYYVECRPIDDVVKICDYLEEKGLMELPLNWALKKTILKGNLEESLNLMSSMKLRNLPLRSHYFWPLFAQNSDAGNSKILRILREMKNLNVFRSKVTLLRYVFPNYNFQDNYVKEFESLRKNAGSELVTAHALVVYLLKLKKIEEVCDLVAQRPIARPHLLLPSLMSELELGTEKQFVKIMYSLLHDVEMLKSASLDAVIESENEEADMEERVDTINIENFVDMIVNSLIEVKDENVLLNVLTEMLEKKINISVEAGKKLLSKFEFNSRIKDTVQSLMSPEVEFQLDDNLLATKKRKTPLQYRLMRADSAEEAQKIKETLGESASFEDDMVVINMYAKNGNISKALELCEKLKTNPQDDNFENCKRLYFSFIYKAADSENIEALNKAFEIGEKLGFNGSDFNHGYLIKKYISNNDLNKATEIFCKRIENGQEGHRYSSLVSALIDSKNVDLLQKVTDTLRERGGEINCALSLAFEFAKKGQVAQVRKILGNFGQLRADLWRSRCQNLVRRNSEVGLKTLIAATKEINVLNRVFLYNMLLELYIRNNKVDKARDLFEQLQGENITDIQFFETYSNFIKNSAKNVGYNENRDFIRKNMSFNQKKNETNNLSENLVDVSEKEALAMYEKALKGNYTSEELFQTMFYLSSHGLVDETLKLINGHQLKSTKARLLAFKLCENDIDKYIYFLKECSKMKPELIEKSFFAERLGLHLLKNKQTYKEMHDLAIQLFESQKNFRPLLTMFWFGVKNPEFLKYSEDISRKFLQDPSQRVFSERFYKPNNEGVKVMETVLENEVLKKIPSLNTGKVYSSLISHYVLNHDIQNALKHFKEAVENNHVDSIPLNVISSLYNVLAKENIEFPYPSLLEKLKI